MTAVQTSARDWIRTTWRSLGFLRGLLALAAVLAVWWAYPPRTAGGAMMYPWEPQLMRDILFERSIFGLLAVGMTLVILGGGIDLSVGSVLGMAGICFAVFTLRWRWPIGPAVAGSMAAGMAAGLLSGLWVVNLRIGLPVAAAVFGAPMLVGLAGWHWAPAGAAVVAAGAGLYFLHRGFGLARTMQPFAATLAMMVIARGAAKWFSGGAKVQSADVPRFYGWLTTGRFPPLIVVFLTVVALAWVMLRWTRTGRHLYAVGGNAASPRPAPRP